MARRNVPRYSVRTMYRGSFILLRESSRRIPRARVRARAKYLENGIA